MGEFIMIKIEGLLVNAFTTQPGKNAKGEVYEAKKKIQLLGSLELPNGDIKNELIDLSVSDLSIFEPFKNKKISLDIGVISSGRNIVFYALKNSKPVLAEF